MNASTDMKGFTGSRAGRVFLVATLTALMMGMVSGQSGGLIDGFEDGDFSEYSGDTQYYSVTQDNPRSGQYSLKFELSDTNYEPIASTSGLNRYFNKGETVEFYHYIDGQTVRSEYGYYFLFGVGDESSRRPTYRIGWSGSTKADAFRFQYLDSNGNTDDVLIDNSFSADDIPEDEWVRHEVAWHENDTIEVIVEAEDGTELGRWSAQDSRIENNNGIGFSTNGDGDENRLVYFDDLQLANNAPSIDSVGTDPGSWTLGSSVNVSGNVSDDGTVTSIYADVWEDGAKIVDTQPISFTTTADGGAEFTAEDLFTVDQADVEYELQLTATDDDGATSTYTRTETIDDSSAGLKAAQPKNKTYGTINVGYDVYLNNDNDDVENETASCTLYEDGSSFTSFTLQEGGVHNTGPLPNISDGPHTFLASCTENQGTSNLQDVYREFYIDTQPPEIEVSSPSGDLDVKKDVPLEFSVSDPNLDSSSCEYSKDGGARFSISNCENTTVTFNTVGMHNLTVYASDTLGHEGSTTSSFSTDYLNWVELEDSVSSASIQEFEVTFSNGTASAGGSTGDGRFEILTSELPRGSVEMVLRTDGYKIRNESFSVSDSFELRETYSMDRASFSLDALSEAQQSDLRFNFTAFNSTDTFERSNVSSFSEDYRNFGDIGFPTGDVRIRVQDVDGQHYQRTYFADVDENSVVDLKAYLLERGQGILTNIEVRDPQNEPLSNALVSIQRNIGTTFKTVSQARTASDGSYSFYLSPDTSYQALINHPEYSSFQGTFNPASYQYSPLIVQLGSENEFTDSTTWAGIEYMLGPDQETLNATSEYRFNWTVVDPENGLTGFGIRLLDSEENVLQQKSVTGSPSGGSVSLQANISELNVSSGEDLLVTGYFVKDGTEYNYRRRYNVLKRVEPGIYSLSSLMGDFESNSSGTARSFIALLFTLVVGSGLKSRFNTFGGGLVTLLVLGIFTWQGWFDPFFWILTGLALIGIYGRGRV